MFTFPLSGRRIPEATNYDGSDFATVSSIRGIADGKTGLISGWVDIDVNQDFAILSAVSGAVQRFVLKYESGKFKVESYNSSATRILNLVSNSSYGSTDGWIHVISSWDLATGAGHLYISDADDEAAGSTKTNDTIDYTVVPGASSGWRVATIDTGSSKLDGCLSELWFNTEYLDISNTTNRRKFITAGGKPADLGSDGSTPTGSRPLIYSPSGDPHYNRGTGGTFTQQSNVEACATSPHD